MICFLTDWNLGIENFETDILFNIVRTFNACGENTTVVNMNPAPFMNYFTYQFDFRGSERIIGLFDQLIEKGSYISVPLGIDDINFPQHYEKTYTNNQVLLSIDGIVKGEVYFNSFGFVSQVHYLLENGKEIDTYSERGFVLSKEVLDSSGAVKEKQLFNELGQLVFTEYPIGVTIGPDYLETFQNEFYDSFRSVCIEIMNNTLRDFNPEVDFIILDGTNIELMEVIRGFAYPENIIYILSGKAEIIMEQLTPYKDLFEKGRSIITDTSRIQNQVKEVMSSTFINQKIQLLPFYSTELELGKSNTYAEQYIYWKIEHFSLEVKVQLLEFLRKKVTLKELCLIIDSKVRTDEGHIRQTVEDFVCQTFDISLDSSEYGLVKEYYEALEKEEMTRGLREQFTEAKKIIPNFSYYIDAYFFIQGIDFRNHPSVQLLKEDLKKVRVFVDQRDEVEYFSHALAVSSGVPLLLTQSSTYLFGEKNGILLEKVDQVLYSVMDYLLDVDHWNRNLVESVEIIQNYSIDGLMHKWRDILR